VITHIVMWRLKEAANVHDKTANARLIREKLEALRGKIPGLLQLEAGLDFSATAASADVVLVTRFESRDALAAYQAHPDHQAVVAFVREVAAERRVADYESSV
jgi:heme-degrading monooxygenase HmoA